MFACPQIQENAEGKGALFSSMLEALNTQWLRDGIMWNICHSFTYKRLDVSPAELNWVIKFSAKL